MKRFAGIAVGFSLLFLSPAFAADTVSPAGTGKSVPPITRAATMRTVGIVVEIAELTVTIERSFKGKKELMAFGLDKPLEGLAVGNKVSVSYMEKDGRRMALKVAKVQERKLPPRKMPVSTKSPSPQPAKQKNGTP